MLKPADMNQAHYSKLERMYLEAPINKSFYESKTITISENTALLTLEVSKKYHHALGSMHGSVYFKLLDDAAYFAAQSIVIDEFLLTGSFHIHFKRPYKLGKVKAIGIIRSQQPNLIIAESKLLNEKEIEIAYGVGKFMKSRVKLSEEIGYK